MTPIRIALMGLGRAGRRWLEALVAHERYEAVAVGDHDAGAESRLDAAGDLKPIRLAFYTDYRQLLVEQTLDAVVMSVPAFVAEPFLPMAAERGVAVLKETPLGRSFEQSSQAVGAFSSSEAPLVVASRWRFEEEIARALLEDRVIGPVRLAEAFVSCELPALPAWRGDGRRSGGGVLLDAGYDLVDLIVAVMGLPDDVLTQSGRFFSLSGERYDTEDCAVLMFRYGSGAAATISAAWRPGPPTWRVCLVGEHGRAELTTEIFQYATNDGDAVTVRRPGVMRSRQRKAANRKAPPEALPADELRRVLDAFAETVRTAPRAYPGRAADQLATAAVFEAAYLSTRTHAVESPVRAYELAGLPAPWTAGAGAW